MVWKLADDPFEYIAPAVCIGSVILIPLGPLYFPRLWILFIALYFMTFMGTQINHLIKFNRTANNIVKTIQNYNGSLKKNKDKKQNYVVTDNDLMDMEAAVALNPTTNNSFLIHAFVIPNYSEPEALIRDTISRIALHKKARTNYVIILAMEASEIHHRTKSESLRDYFKDSFLKFVITNHPSDLPGEARGKGSNISYAARKGCAEMIESGIDKNRIMITIADSDSHIPELYVLELEKAFSRSEDPYFRVYAPPIFFGRNCFEVPAAVRVTDITWSSMIMANLSGSRGIGFPCSTYSVSWKMADRVGYWDTDADAVGEDMHMTLKCLFKTEGQARMIPIFVPINLTNVQTEGYVNNLKARFVQAKRHYNGVADVAYTLRHALNLPTFCVDATDLCLPTTQAESVLLPSDKKLNDDRYSSSFWIEKIIIVLKVLETHFMPVTSGWLMFFAVPIMQFLFYPPEGYGPFLEPHTNPVLVSTFYLHIWNILRVMTFFLPFPLFGTLAIYERLHRFVDIQFFKKTKDESRTWINYFDYVSMPIAAWLFMTFPSNIASCKRLLKTRDQYIVAEKVFVEGRN
ncbi:glycosyl transferase family group 2-domain-containing protein [Cokeromyces recurvatus]|uniref:glycosyl transferase family group 2-domain-containing protein n=1 Tax=Cokeromyces recurvatus TaxID=90255 RepID=UPI00221F6343|nr:glycosyl transferase family group 2-domain-containing protein [Cokeromyces recurvatus]KAI7907637.1 glycosyl transferase family group 2-domain-containing protein [Cokeromyces recurvatus]